MVLPEASVANLSLGFAAALTGLEGRFMSSGFGCLELYLGYQLDGQSTVPTADATQDV